VQASPKTPGIQTDNAALASFFNNLLNKSLSLTFYCLPDPALIISNSGTKKAEPSSSGRKPQRQDIEKELQKIRQTSLPPNNSTPPQ